MNFVFISPNFPKIYSHFVKALAERGVTVLGIGDSQYSELNDELKTYLKEYCFVSDMKNVQWMKNTLDYIEGKYGQIDYIKSNDKAKKLPDKCIDALDKYIESLNKEKDK